MDFYAVYATLTVLLTLIPGNNTSAADNGITQPPAITYSREFLLSYGSKPNSLGPDITLPHELLRVRRLNKKQKRKKRGSRGGVKNRLRRRGSRHPLPVITLSNVRSLNNKLDELSLRMIYEEEFRRSNLICFTETWLKVDNKVDFEGYITIRADRDTVKSQKSIGGGLCILVDKKWATHFTIYEQLCARDYEILVVSFRPFYLPREFGQLTIILVYVPGPNNKEAADRISDCFNSALARSADQPVFILGDYNTLSLGTHLPTLQQYVDCPTRSSHILDLCYGNIENAYKAICRPPIGKSDHNVIHLLPRYRQRVKTEHPVIKTIHVWDRESEDKLKCCFETTNWDIFFDSCSDPHELTDNISSYIQFCEESAISTKQIKIFPNNKPWLSSDLKQCLNDKKLAFLRGDTEGVKDKKRELRAKIQKAKTDFKDKVENSFCTGNPRQAWEGLNKMMGRRPKILEDSAMDVSFANDLNQFYGRFDTSDSKNKSDAILTNIPSNSTIQLSEEEVGTCLSRIKPHKAPGPDGLRGKVLKTCAAQLTSVLTRLFQFLLVNCTMPTTWKVSTIRPVPKTTGSKELNNFRPIALTSVLAKCMERVVCHHLSSSIGQQLDPLQFAYKAHRGTEDATLSMVNMVTNHLQKANTYARILFVDFTAAFNTMQVNVLLKRLLDLGLNGGLVHWIKDFLTDRPQKVCVKGVLSDEIVLNTGAPQGCVLSPLLFSVYTNEMTLGLHNSKYRLFKYADDMALVGLFHKNDDVSDYFAQVSKFYQWCVSSSLLLNIGKTKELILNHADPLPLILCDQTVEIVNCFKYLGTLLDDKLSFTDNTDSIHKKASQRMFLIRKLRGFGVRVDILERVYVSLVESIIIFNITVWYGHLTQANKNKLNRIINRAGKIVGRQQTSLDCLYNTAVQRKALAIIRDETHPLYSEFELLPSGRRYRVPLTKKKIYKGSFIPNAIHLINKAQ